VSLTRYPGVRLAVASALGSLAACAVLVVVLALRSCHRHTVATAYESRLARHFAALAWRDAR
jgi:hypothetical protein